MEVGPFIKLHRIEQEMTQEDLAKGIVSMSYLSKIENERTTASPEVIQMLCTRLGVQLDSEQDELIKQKCQEWYKMLFEVEGKEKLIAAHDEISDLIKTSHSSSSVMFEIHRVRYFLVLGRFEQALRQINKLSEISSTFDVLHQYYWYKFRGNYNSFNNEFNEAMRMYKQAEENIQQIELDSEEIADLQYIIAITHSKLRNTLETIDYALDSLDTFRQKYNFLRCAQCHILLGISYRRIRMYEKAIKNYNLAKHLGKLNKSQQVIQLANQNLGYLHVTKGDKQHAIHHYAEVAKDEGVDLNARVTAVTSLIKAYYSLGDIEKTKELIKQGYDFLDDINGTERFKMDHYIIRTYDYATREEHEQFEALVIDELIPFLKEHNDYANIVLYANMLGDHFEKASKYKESVKYYKLANINYDQLVSI